MSVIPRKAKKFISGRLGLISRIREACKGQNNIVWVHSCSYGEFEEVRPIVREIRKKHPEVKILATFFSPSGYEFLKDDPIADWVFYLPLDFPGNAKRFLDAVNPVKMILSISDYWLGFLHELRRRHIDAYLTSARFEESMPYFKPWGWIYRNTFKTCFTTIFVRDRKSLEVLERIGATNTELSGDPRMDRVMEIASENWSDTIVDEWCGGEKVFVAGSTLFDEDDELIIALVNAHPDCKFLVVPHEQDPEEIRHLRSSIHGSSVLYTEAARKNEKTQVMIVDVVGILSRLYRYGFAAYVGGGFDGSPHSIVEAAAYGIPVAYGPQFGSHYHCIYLQECGGGKSVESASQLCAWFDSLTGNPEILKQAGDAARKYCVDGSGVTETITKKIFAE